jgi:hypothetical protein
MNSLQTAGRLDLPRQILGKVFVILQPGVGRSSRGLRLGDLLGEVLLLFLTLPN